MVGHLLDQADSSMRNKLHEVGLIASSELEENYWNESVSVQGTIRVFSLIGDLFVH